MARLDEKQHSLKLGTALGALVTLLAACASYDGSNQLHTYSSAEDGGTDSSSSNSSSSNPPLGGGGVGGNGAANAGGAQASAGTASGGTAAGVSGSGPDAGGAAPSTGGAGGASSEGGSSNGGSVVAGMGGSANSGSGGASAAGTGGATAADQLLSQGKPATADSEETDKGNLAALGNDGSATTRWCAADGAGGHYWQVDLGKSFTLGKLQITWEKAVVYQFKVEGSVDATTWSGLLDQTASTNATAAQSYPLPTSPIARYVRITTTTLPNANVWASFFEFQIYGH